MRKFVRITNRKDGNAYTTQRKAVKYIARGLAKCLSATETGIINEIAMLETAELSIARSTIKRMSMKSGVLDSVTGKFEWFVGDSGGSSLMKQYEGISGGHRVYQATHGN